MGKVRASCALEVMSSEDAVRACESGLLGSIDDLKSHGQKWGDLLMEKFEDSAAYPNEVSFHQKDWKNQFWGTNYDKLEGVKKKYDPDGMFRCHHCVGSRDDPQPSVLI